MKAFAWTSICISLGLCLTALLLSPPARAKKGGKGGDDTPTFIPVSAIFEALDDNSAAADITVDGGDPTPLDDAALAEDGGWTHFANLTGNYTFQIGDLGRKPVAGDRTLIVDLNDAVSTNPAGPDMLSFNSVFMAFNRYDCEQTGGSNDFGKCATDQWRNPDFDEEFRSGLLRMDCGEEVNVGITMRGTATNGTDYLMSCNESTSYNDDNDPADPDIEFATAACVHQDPAGGCDQWLIYSKDRNPAAATGVDGIVEIIDGEVEVLSDGVSCFVTEDERRGEALGVFDMDFRIHLCADGAPCAVDPLQVTPACID